MLNNRYFRLNPECFLTVGAKRSVVQNLYTGEALWMDPESTQALVRSETNLPADETLAVFQQLEQRKWGFFSDHPPFIDKLRTFNVFREKRLWKETPYIGTAVLQLTNECRRGCPSCTSAFCPICTVFPQRGRESLTVEEWRQLISELRGFGTRFIIFTGGEAFLFPGLADLVLHAAALGVAVQVHTSGLLRPQNDFPEAGFSILLTHEKELPYIAANFAGRRYVTLLNMGVPPSSLAGFLAEGWKVQNVSPNQPCLTKEHLLQTDFDRFFARKQTESCLNGKIYIAHDGAVFPCFGHKDAALADVRKDSLGAAVKVLMENYWNVPIDKVDLNRKCSRCEFRYCCSSCRYMDAEHGCSYQPDCGAWQSPGKPLKAIPG